MLTAYEWIDVAAGSGPRVVRRKEDGRCGVVLWDAERQHVGALYPGTGGLPGGQRRIWGPETDATVEREVRGWLDEPSARRLVHTLNADREFLHALEPSPRQPGRIVQDPRVLGGKPTVEGTRISVEQILGLLEDGARPEEIVDAYPVLGLTDVRAAIAWAREAASHASPDSLRT